MSRRWFTEDDNDSDDSKEKRANNLYHTIVDIEMRQREVHEQFLCSARLYANREVASFDWGNYDSRLTSMAPLSLLGENLVQSIVDTLVSMVGKIRVKPTPVPHSASFKVRKQIKKLDKWLYGEFIRLHVFAAGKRVFRNSLVYNFGGVRIDKDGDKLCLVELKPDNVIVDQGEVEKLGAPRHIYERECLPCEWVEKTYGLDEGTLSGHDSTTAYGSDYRAVGSNHVIVVRGYRAAGPDGPGRYVIACENRILHEEVWTENWLPYAFYHYNEPLCGFYWPSVVEQTIPYQIRLNEVNEVIRDAQDLMARPRIWVPRGSGVTPLDFDNVVGRIIQYTGVKPEPGIWPAVPAELYSERDRVVRTCHEQFGITQMVSQGKLPQGARLDSARAINEATAISDDRQGDPIQRYEEWYLKIGELLIRMMGKFKLKYSNKSNIRRGTAKIIQEIKWEDIDLDNEAYSLTLEAASIFSMTPAARRDTLEEWLRSGKIDLNEYRRLESHPDLEGAMDLLSSAATYTEFVCDEIEDGHYIGPTQIEDLTNGRMYVTQRYLLLAAYDDVDASVKFDYLKWLAMASAILEGGTKPSPEEQAAPQPMQPAPAGAAGMNAPIV